MISDVIKLIKEERTQDDYGVWTSEESSTTVFCNISSISQSEWHEGGRNGLNPAFRFLVFAGDYNDEEIVEYSGKRYYIYRTYVNGDTVELYTEKRSGA